jgi:predicted TIM-barrel fold metal-dependent hydrolase
MANTDRVVVVSGDGHMSAPLDDYLPYLDKRFHSAMDELREENRVYLETAAIPRRPTGDSLKIFDTRGAIGEGQIGDNGEAGSFDVTVRLRELDAEGIAAEVIHYGDQCAITPFFGPTNKAYPPDLRLAGAQAHNRKMAEYMAQAGGRLGCVAELGPCLDMDVTLGELNWAAEHGFVGVTVPGSPADPSLPGLHDGYWDRLWADVEDAGLVLSVHAGWGQTQGTFGRFFQMMNELGIGELDTETLEKALAGMADSPLKLDMGPRRVLWQLMLGGAFDRHPTLKLALTEIRADWVPATLAHLDARVDENEVKLDLRPSEYFQRHCVVTPSSIHAAEVAMRHEIGVGQLCFGADIPHYEGTWPNSREWYKAAFAGVPELEARKIVGGNLLNWYNFDRALVEQVGQRVGPTIEEVIGGQPVDDALIGHFHKRSGYSREAESVDIAALDSALREDLASAGA